MLWRIRHLLAAFMGTVSVVAFAETIFGVSSPSQDDEQSELREVSLLKASRQAVMAGGGALRDVLRGLALINPVSAEVKLTASLSLWLIGPDGSREPIQTA